MSLSRRTFLKASATTLALSAISYDRVLGANEKLNIGLIGSGGRGRALITEAAAKQSQNCVALCDVAPFRMDAVVAALQKGGVKPKPEFYSDHHKLLEHKGLDAVIIATPDHWHTKIAVDAMKAGKDVYLEKPMVQSLDEGQILIDTARATNRSLLVGSQRVSSIVYQKAKELYSAGAIGELNRVEAWWNRNSAQGAWQYTVPPDASPQTVDWDRFLGKAPKVPFDPIRFFRWRNYRDYGTGVAGDLFVHLFSGLHFVLSSNGPIRVMSTGGLRYWKDGRDVPDVMLGIYEYPKTATHPAFNLSLKVNFADGGGGEEGFRFVGSEGVMTIGRGVTITRKPLAKEPGLSTNTFPKTMQDAIQKEYRVRYPENLKELNSTRDEVYVAPQGYSDQVDHLANFLDAVRTRKPVVEDASFGFRAAGPALATNLSYFNGRSSEWAPEAVKIKA